MTEFLHQNTLYISPGCYSYVYVDVAGASIWDSVTLKNLSPIGEVKIYDEIISDKIPEMEGLCKYPDFLECVDRYWSDDETEDETEDDSSEEIPESIYKYEYTDDYDDI